MNIPFEQTILLNANPAIMKFHDQLHTIVRAFTLHQAVGAAVSRLSGNHYCILRFSGRVAPPHIKLHPSNFVHIFLSVNRVNIPQSIQFMLITTAYTTSCIHTEG